MFYRKSISLTREGTQKKAVAQAQKEIQPYNDQIEEEYNDKITALTSDDSVHDNIKQYTQEVIQKINQQYQANKSKALDFVFNAIIKIDIEIPAVVVGNFEDNFKV